MNEDLSAQLWCALLQGLDNSVHVVFHHVNIIRGVTVRSGDRMRVQFIDYLNTSLPGDLLSQLWVGAGFEENGWGASFTDVIH